MQARHQAARQSKRKVVMTVDKDMEKVLAVLEAAGISPTEAVAQFLAAFEKARKMPDKKNMSKVGV